MSQIFQWLLMYSQRDFHKAEVQSHADLKDDSSCATDLQLNGCVCTTSERQCLTRAVHHTAAAALLCIPLCVCLCTYVCFGLGELPLHYRDLPCDVGRFINSRTM